jgi:transposase-like protein
VGAPLSEEVRAAIIADIEAGKPRNQIARDHGVGRGTVSGLAKKIKPDAFNRSATAAATEARVVDLAARRAAFAQQLLDLAEHVAARCTSAYVVHIPVKNEVITMRLGEPPLSEVKHGMAAVGIAVTQHINLLKYDTKPDEGNSGVSLVDRLAQMLALDVDQGDGYDDGYPEPLPSIATDTPAAGDVDAGDGPS